MSSYLAIDFEASCLPRHGRSFPVEVGIADHSGSSRAWLIRPHADWEGWTWTREAEALHGLSPGRLHRDGLPAAQVAAEVAEAVAGRRVIADSRLDAAWLVTLCAAAGRTPPFRIEHITDLIAELGTPDPVVQAALDTATRLVPGRHRAEIDALWLATLIGALLEHKQAAPVPVFPWEQPDGATEAAFRPHPI